MTTIDTSSLNNTLATLLTQSSQGSSSNRSANSKDIDPALVTLAVQAQAANNNVGVLLTPPTPPKSGKILAPTDMAQQLQYSLNNGLVTANPLANDSSSGINLATQLSDTQSISASNNMPIHLKGSTLPFLQQLMAVFTELGRSEVAIRANNTVILGQQAEYQATNIRNQGQLQAIQSFANAGLSAAQGAIGVVGIGVDSASSRFNTKLDSAENELKDVSKGLSANLKKQGELETSHKNRLSDIDKSDHAQDSKDIQKYEAEYEKSQHLQVLQNEHKDLTAQHETLKATKEQHAAKLGTAQKTSKAIDTLTTPAMGVGTNLNNAIAAPSIANSSAAATQAGVSVNTVQNGLDMMTNIHNSTLDATNNIINQLQRAAGDALAGTVQSVAQHI